MVQSGKLLVLELPCANEDNSFSSVLPPLAAALTSGRAEDGALARRGLPLTFASPLDTVLLVLPMLSKGVRTIVADTLSGPIVRWAVRCGSGGGGELTTTGDCGALRGGSKGGCFAVPIAGEEADDDDDDTMVGGDACE
jgi:hypothetical protein